MLMSTNRFGESTYLIEMDLCLITAKLKKEHPIIQKPIKAHPKKAAVLVGLLDRFEIWNPGRYAAVRGEDQVMASAAFTLME